MMRGADSLNEFQASRVRVTCQYVANLLGEIENIVNVSASKAAFPRHTADISLAQRRTIEDYTARICAQLKRVLDGQGIPLQKPSIPASRAISVTLGSIDIAAEELKPQYMRGYGPVPETVATELNGIAAELHGLVTRLERYLLEGAGQDLKSRLERLEDAGNDLRTLARIEQVVANRGLVEYRSTIASILDRAEDKTFEIAVFGRVSSGKSSLLNAILETEVLPIGVTPVTAVPTRITYGEKSSIHVFFAEAPAKTFELGRLAEFATEQENPGNAKRVTRVVVELPARRLERGVSFVDTPGLGSLATSGAAETLAYLPKCDLGVVLIDAGATLTSGDLQTILTLQEATVPVNILLSKADLLNPPDQQKILEYIKGHIASECNLELPIHPVSVLSSHRELLSKWFENQILPLYDHSQELRAASLRRKIGALRESVVSALQVRLQRKRDSPTATPALIRSIEARLRRATGLIEEAQAVCEREVESIPMRSPELFQEAAARLMDSWEMDSGPGKTSDATPPEDLIRNAMLDFVQRRVKMLQDTLNALGIELRDDLRKSAAELGISDAPGDDEFHSLLRGTPVFDPGTISASVSRRALAGLFGRQSAEKRLARKIRQQMGEFLGHALETHLRLLSEWVRTVLAEYRGRFEAYAEGYRAQAERSLGGLEVSEAEFQAIEDDLKVLGMSEHDKLVGNARVRAAEK